MMLSVQTGEAKTNEYKIVFVSNGGSGNTSTQVVKYGKLARLRGFSFKKKGYFISGWAKSKGGKKIYDTNGYVKNIAKPGKTIKLYAKWKNKDWKRWKGVYTNRIEKSSTDVGKRENCIIHGLLLLGECNFRRDNIG